jgi:hypothetical protein
MVARSSGLIENGRWGRDATSDPVPQSTADEFGMARLGDLLPQVLKQYGVSGHTLEARTPNTRAKTNRPGIAQERCRVG